MYEIDAPVRIQCGNAADVCRNRLIHLMALIANNKPVHDGFIRLAIPLAALARRVKRN